MKPFLYIAGLFRSGTTLVQEMFTEKDKSFIFHEPRFGDGWWQFQEHDRRYLRTWEWDLPQFQSIGSTWSWFLDGMGLQIGVKEIRNAKGGFYYDSWRGNMRFIVVDRDPRDIYISCYKMLMRNNSTFTWSPQYTPFSAINVYRELIEEVNHINRVWEMCHPDCRMVVKYNDLCEGSFQPMYEFAESDVYSPDIGGYHAILPRGVYETKTHRNSVTTKSLNNVDVLKSVVKEGEKLRKLINEEKLWT